jgi:hypothetical protein
VLFSLVPLAALDRLPEANRIDRCRTSSRTRG